MPSIFYFKLFSLFLEIINLILWFVGVTLEHLMPAFITNTLSQNVMVSVC